MALGGWIACAQEETAWDVEFCVVLGTAFPGRSSQSSLGPGSSPPKQLAALQCRKEKLEEKAELGPELRVHVSRLLGALAHAGALASLCT